MWLFALGFVFHLIFFLSVFDIYFRTPISHGMTPQVVEGLLQDPAATRLVLVVADGLRADTFFSLTNNNTDTRAPYLRWESQHHYYYYCI